MQRIYTIDSYMYIYIIIQIYIYIYTSIDVFPRTIMPMNPSELVTSFGIPYSQGAMSACTSRLVVSSPTSDIDLLTCADDRECLLQMSQVGLFTLYNIAPHCATLRHIAPSGNALYHIAPHCPTLPNLATHCTILHHIASHCATLHHITNKPIRLDATNLTTGKVINSS